MTSPGESLLPLLYGDAPMDVWLAASGGSIAEPWASMRRAALLLADGNPEEAVRFLRRVANTPGLESRQVLQAWHFLREAGLAPPADRAAEVLGVMAEVGVDGGRDVLVAYLDGSVRYVNFSGSATIVEAPDVARLAAAVTTWFAVAQKLAFKVGPWGEPALPDLPADQTRILMLTPAGPRFGQGPDDVLREDIDAAHFLDAALGVLQVVTTLV